VSLDGVTQAPGDPSEYPRGGWQKPYIGDDQLTLIVEQVLAADALLLGRKTYEGFAAAWPSMTGMGGLADRMDSMPKFVASTSLTEVAWNATLIKRDLTRAVEELKQHPGNGLVVAGSGAVVHFLAEHDEGPGRG
jgi:dihydrofolate reductase